MDQDTMVTQQTDSGQRLIEALGVAGFKVQVAFWAKPTDEGKWFLYLASPAVEEKGLAAAYRIVHSVIRQTPDLWIDPFEVRVIGGSDALTMKAEEITKPKVATGPFAISNPKPYPGMTRFGGTSFGGVDVDGVLIYPPPASASA